MIPNCDNVQIKALLFTNKHNFPEIKRRQPAAAEINKSQNGQICFAYKSDIYMWPSCDAIITHSNQSMQ